jgi:glycerophosphoryl diester phosphodiesterase
MFRKLSAISLFILLTTMTQSQVKIIAHRGASFIAPENTIASAMLAWNLGADAVEVDIFLSKDDRIICSHDATTKRITGEDYRISVTDSKILRKLDAGSFKSNEYKGEKLPFLEEIIETIPAGKELVIEIKCGTEVLPFLKRIIDKTRKKVIFTFICFDLNTITETKKIFPANSCYWLCSNKELLSKNFDLIPGVHLEGISLSYGIINREVMDKAESLNLEVYSWTIDDPAEARRLISLGVKGITTNRPGWLSEQMRE